MPIFWLMISTMGAGRSLMSVPEHSLSMDSAASCPCATAQMMFLGPNAASPPKNTLGWVEAMVLASTLGMSHLSNSTPISRSIQGKAFSCPTATSTSSHGTCWSGSPVGTSLRRPFASYSALTFSNTMPVRRPLSWVNSFGTRKLRIGMSSCIASSFSQGDAFISSKPERTITFTSSPPRRRDVRQQSIAVLPAPRPRPGAHEPRVPALGEQRLQAVHPLALAQRHAEPGNVADLLVDDRLREPEPRDLTADHAAGVGVGIDDGDFVAHGREIARDGQRGRPATYEHDALAVAALGRRRQAG